MALPKDQTDTGKRLEAVKDAVREVMREESAEMPAAATPTPGESAEHVRLIARDEVNKHAHDCHGIGELKEWVGTMQVTQNLHSDWIARNEGEQRFKRWVIPLLAAFAGSGAAVALAGLLFKGIFHFAGGPKP